MPIYQYDCEDCGQHKEEIHKWQEEGYPTPCPHCGSENLRRVPGVPQRPKINGSKPEDKWGYNKTTYDTLIGGDGKHGTFQYDHKANAAAEKEAAQKRARKGATVGGTAIPKKSKK